MDARRRAGSSRTGRAPGLPRPCAPTHEREGTGPMSGPSASSFDRGQWRTVDEGWGRQAVEFATLAEPANCREYVTVHQHLGVGAGDKLLDIACGAGLSVELAGLRGA